MDLRTKISTVLAAIAYVNGVFAMFYMTVLQNIDVSILEGHPTIQKWYAIISAIGMGAIWLNSHYFNQNFTPEGVMGTALTHDLKNQFNGE